MGKTKETIKIERNLVNYTSKDGFIFGCEEVTIGIGGRERVDYITIDTKQIVRCYEVKVSKQDFYSKAKKTFIGNYNYYVIPKELFDKVKKDIPSHIGVIINGNSVKKNPKKQELGCDINTILISIVRSLHRESKKVHESENVSKMKELKRQINLNKTYYDSLNKRFLKYREIISDDYGKNVEYKMYKKSIVSR